MRLAKRRNLQTFGKSAGDCQVGLKDVDRTAIDQFRKVEPCEFALSGGNRYGTRRSNFRKAGAIVRHYRLFNKSQVEFGISVAQRGLWREAIYRWEKATELDPTYVAAFNDLAIAYEHEGQLDKARKAYEKALEIEPNNTQVRQNYELFKEINDRTSAGKQQ